MIAADAGYLEGLWQRFHEAPEKLAPDWRNAFAFVAEFYGEPEARNRGDGRGRFEHLRARLDPLGLQHGDDDRTLTIETGHIDDPAMIDWIEAELASAPPRAPPDPAIHKALLRGSAFERFAAIKFPGKKRFGSEGAEMLVPLVEALLERAAAAGTGEVVVGGMHRGRLALMGCVFGVPLARLFALIRGRHPWPGTEGLAADVPYHLGADHVVAGMPVRLLPNPSHLEAINPVAIGHARMRAQVCGRDVMALVLHTDASVVAQGVNAELIQMVALDDYEVGGTVHVIVNNQIGFTTEPREARSGSHCTAGWRAADSLILHVNGADPGAVIRAADIALRFRARFRRDAVIDLVCYRANGHNEIDEPRFTQPRYYRAADSLGSLTERYERELSEAGVADTAELIERRQAVEASLAQAFAASAEIELSNLRDHSPAPCPPPGPDAAQLTALGLELSRIPTDAGAHPKMVRLTHARAQELEQGISWAFAEALALAATLRAGISVRLAGQDTIRGAFSQRHLAAVDPATGGRTSMLERFAVGSARVEIVNSPLSEYAVLGFEYGRTINAPPALSIWEAQFGDFANCAQPILDQFLCSGEVKWGQRSNLTVLLPHGLEGQGPEHSSARPERLLQLCALDNMTLAQPSTPANFFHLLRVQAWARRPLIVLAPKLLLRLAEARSSLAELAAPARFQRVLVHHRAKRARRTILCSGKIAYELEKLREASGHEVNVVTLEQFYPFPTVELEAALSDLEVGELIWLQEEPENFGAWNWLEPRLRELAARCGWAMPRPIARPESPSPAGSFHELHAVHQRALLERALSAGPGA